MSTRQLLELWHEMEKRNASQQERLAFLATHESNKRFLSLIQLKQEFISALASRARIFRPS